MQIGRFMLTPALGLCLTVSGWTGVAFPNELSVSPDGEVLAVGTLQGDVQLWHWRNSTMTKSFHPGNGFVHSLAFIDSGRRLVLSMANDELGGDIYTTEIASGASVLVGQAGKTVIAMPDGGAAVESGDHLSLLNSQGEYHDIDIMFDETVVNPALSPDGAVIAAGGMRAHYKDLVFYGADGGFIRSVPLGYLPQGTVFSPDGTMVAVYQDENGGVSDPAEFDPATNGYDLIDVAKGKRLHRLQGHKLFLSGGAFSPDGAQFLSWSGDGTLILWDVATGKQIRALVGHGQSIKGGAFLDGGKLIASFSMDGAVKIWSALTGDEIASMRP